MAERQKRRPARSAGRTALGPGPAGRDTSQGGEVRITATDLWRMSATDLATAIRSGQASSREVIEAHLRRIEAVNPPVNAVTVVLGEQAQAAAKAADQAVAGGGELRALHGVPFTVKENIDLAGTPTTQGIEALAGAVPGRDAPHVARLRAAGAIPIGHTNHPLIVAPVFTGLPWEPGKDLTTTGVAEILRGMRMAVAVNALGLPAVTLPVGTGGGLPRSVQVIGPRYREDLCPDAAAALEDRAGILTPIDPRGAG